MEEGSRRAAAAAAAVLPDELIVEILARLPVKSLGRCQCVSRAWRALISDPTNRRRFAQTLSGFFFTRPNGSRDFIGLSMSSVAPPPPGVDTALSFLPPTCGDMELLDSCNGLLLLCCKGVGESPAPLPLYVVCNPATAEWVTLPQPSCVPGLVGNSASAVPTFDTSSAALGFDPSISPHFHVFQLVQVMDRYYFAVQGVEIYSSQTGRWVITRAKCSDRKYIKYTVRRTGAAAASIPTSVGSLKPRSLKARSGSMSIYVLKDHDSEEWIWDFKQRIDKRDLFGSLKVGVGRMCDCYIAACHPDCDLIFFYHFVQKRLVSYDMKHRDVHVICTLEVPHFKGLTLEFQDIVDVRRRFFPYVPLYSRALPSSCLS